ncbi:MAG: DUF4129 domain-containing protein [Acidobacteriota bacterium]
MKRFLLVLGLLLLASPLAAGTIPVDAYRVRLTEIQARLRSGDWIGARAEARRTLDDRIAWPGGTVEPDASVLGPIARAARPAEADAAAPRLGQLVSALSESREDAPVAADPKLLDEVRSRQALAELPQGGRLPEVQDGGLLAALAGFLKPVADFFGDLLERLWEWFLDLFPEPGQDGSKLGLDLKTVTALVVGLALVLAWVGWRVLRRRRRGAALVPAGPAPLPPAADDDPLSREANEWERYARELAAAGRHREAVRAWYHSVLVALYRTGALHHRKGRTNWEYVSAVPPGTPWRAGFAEMTRHFEREWYGRDQSDAEALRESEAMALAILAAVQERAA